MRNIGLSKLQNLLFVLLMFALTGCGASNSNIAGTDGNPSAKLTAKFDWAADGKSTAKTVEAVPAGVVSVRLRITGPYQIPGDTTTASRYTASKATFPAAAGGGSVAVFPGTGLIVIAEALDAGDTVLYEGIVKNVSVVAGATTDLGTITIKAPPVKEADKPCLACHENSRDENGNSLVVNYKTSRHYNITASPVAKYGVNSTGCAGCHGPQHNDLNPAESGRCFECHNAAGNFPTFHAGSDGTFAYAQNKCAACHNPHLANVRLMPTGDVAGCTLCHAIGQNATASGSFVNDNSGVRGITAEFNKRSHHITGGAPNDAQCVVCHLEGKALGSAVVVDTAYHMKDDKIYLRNADTDAAFVWGGTEHTAMDNFCFSCHDANGATSPGIAAIMTGKNFGGPFSANNPFADTLTNSYDQVARAGVVDVKTAFTTTNASHHAVSGQRYTYRFSTLANAQAWAARTGKPVPAASEIAEGHTVDGELSPFGTGLTYDPHGAEEGGEATLYEGGKFVSTYIPLGASLNVADNSTLHCGDCHTVGQWKAGSSTNADGSATTAVIGAHGSANEYLLRNSLGTDAIHNGLTYVCFNCHATSQNPANATTWAEQVAEGLFADSVAPASGSPLNPLGKYIPLAIPTTKAGWGALHPTVFMGQFSGYAVAHAVSAFHGQCQADSADNIGATDRASATSKSWGPNVVKAYDYIPAPGATAVAPAAGSNAGSGNITGIACTNCHNSALRSGFGGIHGGDNTYTDGLGRVQKSYRFMPGMGNYRYAPPGGWDGKDVSDPSLLTVNNPVYPGTPGSRTDSPVGFPGASGKPMGGCYTNGAAADLNPGYSACSHHGTSTALSTKEKNPTDPKNANFRTSYGGGTTGNPTTYEPTIREATAGGTLVTRPLKY